MKKRTLTHFIFTFLILMTSCVKKGDWTEGKVLIKGNILNYDSNKSTDHINIIGIVKKSIANWLFLFIINNLTE